MEFGPGRRPCPPPSNIPNTASGMEKKLFIKRKEGQESEGGLREGNPSYIPISTEHQSDVCLKLDAGN